MMGRKAIEHWYNGNFPEALYPCHVDFLDNYKQLVIAGRELMESSTVCVCGIARNNANILPNTLARIDRLIGEFKDYRVIVYENDSVDNTLGMLKDWAGEERRKVILHETLAKPVNFQDKSIKRREAMAYARNQYLQTCRDYSKRYDFVIVVDMDLLGGWSYEGIANSFGWTRLWDVVASNGLYYRLVESDWQRLFYDSWAFRRLGHQEPHDDAEINVLNYNRGEPPIRVFSAFSGLAIYKGKYIYGNTAKYTAEDCDHPTLHKQLIDRGATIWLNPSMITLYSTSEYTICQSQ